MGNDIDAINAQIKRLQAAVLSRAVLIIDNEDNDIGYQFVCVGDFAPSVVATLLSRSLIHGKCLVGVAVVEPVSAQWAPRSFADFVEEAFGYWCCDLERATEFFAGVSDDVVRNLADAWLDEFVADAQERLPRIEEPYRPRIIATIEQKRQRRLWFDEFLAGRTKD